ncbi:NACHT domain-containing protein [Streptomyces sp. Je 1-369]|uniref:NACHT domain-containing protein n=1 Tax=Streptomyces sp. Je 1-369 TaxID=2966192 RepID=UPI00228688D9|nr:NACHT domain-containing protein [Streptomyces sp. Je 1-369]WAL97056.1 NACHT domain-containing protein [Streptomyces sp. Je 1-369]
MVDPGALGARLASSAVAPLVKKLFVKDQPGAALVTKPVRISGLVSFRGEKRDVTPKDVEKIADELVRRALRAAGPGEAPVDAGEAVAVRTALALSLAALGTLTIEDYEAVALGPDEFARTLRSQSAVTVATFTFSSDAELFLDRLLHTASLHILNFFTQRSTYIARQQTQQSRQLAQLVKAVDVLLDRLPSQSAEDAAFEARYASYITSHHGTLTIYGLDVYAGTSEWPLDTAYLSLEATRDRLGEGAAQVAAEQVLAQHDHVLLRGVAGSGKTTLVQWLAVTAADRTYEHGLTHLIGRVPFVLPMRRIVRPGTELPAPYDFLTAVGCLVAGEEPPGWVNRVLRAGRGVLLVDGLDEISEDRRESAKRWLRDLTRTFPGNLWLVTTRPSAVPDRWLDTTGFAELTLSPMTRDDVETFVRRWHRAAGADDGIGTALLETVRAASELNRLATNPLMCGMLCALHRERRGFLPQDRKSLYEAALTMLLERRDVERDVMVIRLPFATQVQLLQKLAWWLIRNSRSEMDETDAVSILGGAAPAMNIDGSGEEVYHWLLLRSGLLREPAVGRVDFLHRTFQDYLGARLAVQELDFDLLLNNADRTEWEDVILLAVAHARPKEAERMLQRLVAGGTARGKLLAAAGAAYAAELAPVVRQGVEEGVRSLIPPRTEREAYALAEAGGDLVLHLLPGPDDVEGELAHLVPLVAAKIGSDPALHFLTRFRDHPDRHVQLVLTASWTIFDREPYVSEILAHLSRRPLVPVHGAADLRALRSIGGWPNIKVIGAYRVEDLVELIVPEQLTRLSLDAPHPVEGLAWLSAFPRLTDVDVGTEVDADTARQLPSGVRLNARPAQGT